MTAQVSLLGYNHATDSGGYMFSYQSGREPEGYDPTQIAQNG